MKNIYSLKFPAKAITSVGCPKMKRDTGVNAVFLLRKKTAFTPASLFIFGRPTDVMALVSITFPGFSALAEQNCLL